ncbi:MAG: hypothetical protein A3C15_02830 [Candidatus Magasanikbacteria bacterium RIFCSPHIGHO2_02_FULL_50_9b]|uniref:Uncharacterized protein n=1 Tax=Candidatus Magasanikbacteria bacterium RIFCSPHIGHO2_02_FULL_50_9b TaxID=1798682 RepID=A0A1F6M806_9BACT|nr:MAG: hypothetical protein A3C15_02830 [Candidatus Magasanikbacteria bacterium RIFCSPHIGHO2_02_FULL_50_9b]
MMSTPAPEDLLLVDLLRAAGERVKTYVRERGVTVDAAIAAAIVFYGGTSQLKRPLESLREFAVRHRFAFLTVLIQDQDSAKRAAFLILVRDEFALERNHDGDDGLGTPTADNGLHHFGLLVDAKLTQLLEELPRGRQMSNETLPVPT